MKGPPKKATTNIEVAGSAASCGLTLLIYMTCCQLVPSMSLRHFQVGAKKQGSTMTFTEWNLFKWPHWLQVLPLTLMWMVLIAEMMGSEPLHTWPMFLHSQVFFMHFHCQQSLTSSQPCSHRIKLLSWNWRLQGSWSKAIRVSTWA